MSSAPAPYDRVTSFYSYEASYPSLPKSGTSLDAEFEAARAAINATQSRLAEIQRDDGSLANASVHPQALTSETFVLLGSDFTPRGSWLTTTTYDPGDLVERTGLNYLSVITHVSGDFDVDLAAGKWQAFGGYPTAAQVVFAPGGSVGALSVQDAIIELDGDVQNKQPIDPTLSALAGQLPGADQILYFTGDDTAAVAAFTAAARAFVAATTAVAQRAVIGITLGEAAGNVLQLDGSAKLPAVDGSQLTAVIPADGAVTAAKLAAALDLSGKTVTLPAANTPAFVKSFASPEQTITAAGALSLAHAMAVAPKLIVAELVCKVAEQGYSINDVLAIGVGLIPHSTANRGVSVVSDSTNLSVRYGSDANTFAAVNKTTGAIAALTNASWRLVLRAYA